MKLRHLASVMKLSRTLSFILTRILFERRYLLHHRWTLRPQELVQSYRRIDPRRRCLLCGAPTIFLFLTNNDDSTKFFYEETREPGRRRRRTALHHPCSTKTLRKDEEEAGTPLHHPSQRPEEETSYNFCGLTTGSSPGPRFSEGKTPENRSR